MLPLNFQAFVLLSVLICVLLSEGDEGYPDDNTNDIFLPLKYQTELLFTRWLKLLSFL